MSIKFNFKENLTEIENNIEETKLLILFQITEINKKIPEINSLLKQKEEIRQRMQFLKFTSPKALSDSKKKKFNFKEFEKEQEKNFRNKLGRELRTISHNKKINQNIIPILDSKIEKIKNVSSTAKDIEIENLKELYDLDSLYSTLKKETEKKIQQLIDIRITNFFLSVILKGSKKSELIKLKNNLLKLFKYYEQAILTQNSILFLEKTQENLKKERYYKNKKNLLLVLIDKVEFINSIKEFQNFCLEVEGYLQEN